MKYLIIFAILLISIGGCNNKFTRASTAELGKTELVGKSKTDILTCAGAPTRSEKVDDMEFLTYYSGGDSDAYVAGGGGNSAGGGSVSIKQRYCEVTFVLQNNIVQKVNYSGRTGGLITEGEQCAFAIDNCIQ